MAIPFQKTGGPMLSKWLWTLICTQLFAVSFVQSQCTLCEDYKWLQQGGYIPIRCRGCLKNYVENPADPDFRDSLVIVEHPHKRLIQQVNSEVYLACKFNFRVNCKWSKDGVEVEDIGPSFNRKWAAGSGKNTKDCSLIISRFMADDEGCWVCSSMADSDFQKVSSRPTRLSIELPQPKISFRTEVLNGNTEFYPGKEAMAAVKCEFYSSDMAKRTRLWWYLENGQVYRGQIDGSTLKLGHELIRVLDKKPLRQDDKMELYCVAEDLHGQMSMAKVVFIYDEFQVKKGYGPYVIIGLITFIVLNCCFAPTR